MGCTPSKGKLFGGAFSPEQTAVEEPPENSDNRCITTPGSTDPPVLEKTPSDCGSEKDVKENCTVSREEKRKEEKRPSLTQEICDTATVNEDIVQKIEVNLKLEVDQENVPQVDQKPEGKPPRGKGEKRKKIRDGKKPRSKDKLKKGSLIHAKIELPEDMVKAHQAAYSYLNPNISKYETLLQLLDQAAQTQLSLQPMVTMVATRYDEINLTLEEMAKEGEQMLKDHGEHMAWPAGLPRGPLVSAVKQSGDDQNCPRQPPPDLLQQLLQHSTEKMRLVGDSVTSLGDSALEEATEYFASISGLLGEKLKAKRAAEGRLKQVLTRVEAAAVSKIAMEDSALHSEDSGIGGENESLAGSERHRQHRESCQSTAAPNVINGTFLPHGEDGEDDNDEEEEEEDDDDEEEVQEEEMVKPSAEQTADRRSSGSSVQAVERKSSLKAPIQSPVKAKKCTKRPKTADTTKPLARHDQLRGLRRSRSLQNLHQDSSSLEEPTVRSLTEKQERTGKDMDMSKEAEPPSPLRAKLRRHSSSLERRLPSPTRAPQAPQAPQPQGRHAVRRLITTFSHGVVDKPMVPPHVKINRKCHFPMISTYDGPSSCNKYNGYGSRQQQARHDDMDMDSLPPPPPEILMDNSFEVTRGAACLGEGGGTNGPTLSRSNVCQKNTVSQKLRASVQSMSVLPNRASVQQGSLSLSAACAPKSDAVEDHVRDHLDDERTETETHYSHSHKAMHWRDATTSRSKAGQEVVWSPSATPAGMGSRQGSNDHTDSDILSPPPIPWPSTTSPISRSRVPPAYPLVGHHAPTPPSFPSGRRMSSNSEENIPVSTSAAFANARSVFCQEQPTRTLSTTSTLPRPWGESSRGRLPHVTRVPQGFARRSSSEQRAPTWHQTEQNQAEQTLMTAAQDQVVSSATHE